jgi:hypothetical protein
LFWGEHAIGCPFLPIRRPVATPPARFPGEISFVFPLVRWAASATLVAVIAAPADAKDGIPQPQRYAALLAKARAGTLRINHGEAPERPHFFLFRATPVKGPASEMFPSTGYRVMAKTSFASGSLETFAGLKPLFNPLPRDAKMSQHFPPLVKKTGNTTPRIDLEKRNVRVPAWIYWVAKESDHDYHVVLGSTAELTSTTIFMNSEVSGLPEANPNKSPFPQRPAGIRATLANHENENGLFVCPVAVIVIGSLLWDGEHRAPNAVGPEGLQPAKAWEIHPIRQLTQC